LQQRGIDIRLLSDQARYIQGSIDSVKQAAILGGLFAIIVLYLFLSNVWTTVLIALAIPLSVIATFVPMNLWGVSLNIMSLGGLALGIGMLVDNAIVVLESIHRCREEGDEFVAGAIRGVREVSGAVTASTLTTIAVFFPIVFVEGVAGQLFQDMSLTIVFSLITSLLVALFVIPMLATRKLTRDEVQAAGKLRDRFSFLRFSVLTRFRRLSDRIKRVGKPGFGRFVKRQLLRSLFVLLLLPALAHLLAWLLLMLAVALFFAGSYLIKWLGLLGHLLLRVINPLFTPFRHALDWLLKVYPTFLRRVLGQRTVTLGVALVLMVVALMIYPRLGRELIPELHQGEFYLDCVLPVGTALEKTTTVVVPLAESLQELPEVEQVSAQIGSETTSANNPEAGEHYGRLTVRLQADQDFIAAEQSVIASIRQQVQSIPDLHVRVRYPTLFSFTTPIQVVLQGYNLDTLRQLSGRVAADLETISGLTDINTTLQSGYPEVQVVYDRDRLAYHNLNLYEVASLVRDKVLGKVSTRFRDREERIDIRVMVDEADRQNISQLGQLVINPGSEQQLALRDVAQLNIVEGPSEIRRLDRQRSAVITANLSGISLSAASNAINSQLQQLQLPFGFRASLQGQSEEMQRSLHSLLFALMLAIFLVYLVMASQFESLSHPFIIIFAVPLAFIGVALLLLIMDIPISVVVFLGAIMLVGIVVNNAIVLVDYINLLRSRGIEKIEAIVQAAQVRIRPILMTTLTTVLGLLPLAIGWGDGAEMRAPMALTVIGGLLSSTLLTLVVVPVLYSIFDIRKRDA
jgi:HAE1 family hydrophobic/amphiphilic exporter-1